ncbi:MAG: SURF1 family protein [Herminiimonas sp.]|uniref:SURF1 family protein n=1 Tax=Herminiimonas sp. TaxID=1926289 RepID=UPI0027288C8E|nr:SURF1 family protein [Herminiimonas sp.]MDO9421104.1 SURF1 family protein [Herminiimonas sp.]
MVHELQNKDGSVSQETEPSLRSRTTRIVLAVCALLLFAGFVALGTWQVYRLQWKLALIERVDQRVHAAAIAAPAPDCWSQVSAANDEYRHVNASGVFLHELSSKVQAVTALGAGYWLLTPLRAEDGTVVFINRGFITEAQSQAIFSDPSKVNSTLLGNNERVLVTGLLRINEPGGGFLRSNDPVGDRWYSRDVQALAQAHKLTNVAPYFIDAEVDKSNPSSTADTSTIRPVAGLTVIAFHNSHMVYALTWYALALMVAGAAFWVTREERRAKRARAG